MKIVMICFLLFSAAMMAIIPLACGNQNNVPVGVGSGTGPTHTFTPTVGAGGTLTLTPTTVPLTVVPAPTYSSPTPVYQNNYPASAAPNGLSVDVANSQLYVAEGEAGVAMREMYSIGNGTLTGNGGEGPGALDGNLVEIGYPTPAITPAWGGTTITLVSPQAYMNPGGYLGSVAMLDSTSSGPATLYTGQNSWWNGTQYGTHLEPVTCNGYAGVTFNAPKGMVMDSTATTIYVTDTGNARVEALAAQGNPVYPNAWIHYWTSLSPGVPFIKPYAIALDSANDIWVSDTGYNPSVIEAYTSGGATVLSSPLTTVSGCVATGIAVTIFAGPVTHLYVADGGNKLIEEYLLNSTGGTILTAASIPVTYLESKTFNPYSVVVAPSGAVSTNIIVGDIGNDKIEVFQVPNP